MIIEELAIGLIFAKFTNVINTLKVSLHTILHSYTSSVGGVIDETK